MGQLFLWTALVTGLIWTASGFYGINIYSMDNDLREFFSARARRTNTEKIVVFLVFLSMMAWRVLLLPKV